MTIKAQVGFARTGGGLPTRLHRQYKQLPVILVPGVMGSRLSDFGGGLAWNPLGKPLGKCAGAFTVNYDRLQQLSSPLFADEWSTHEEDADKTKWAGVKHYFNVLADTYNPLLEALTRVTDPKFDQYGIRLKVYCCGYDWRQDNARSALRLAEIVEEALRDTGAKRVIIIGHSMGCTVARYYCRVLGGEARVHRLILLGSPTMGAPAAYNYLKIGPPGLYVKDVKTALQQGNESAAVFELMREGGALAQNITSLAMGGGSIMDLFGGIYMALCLGAGRMLTRRETTYFSRLMPSLYQLLPTALFSNKNRQWVFFDPFVTGYKPTGFMVILPTLFEIITGQHLAEASEVLAHASNEMANKVHDDINNWLDPGRAERTSSRAKRNAITIIELYAAITKSMEGSLDEWKFEELIDFIKDFWTRVMETMFVDCRNNKILYEDIYTGFLDHVDMRAISAANVALALRLEQALSAPYGIEKVPTPLDLLSNAFDKLFKTPGGKAFLGGLEDLGYALAHVSSFGIAWAAGLPPDRKAEREAEAKKEEAERPQKELEDKIAKQKAAPKAYMPPQTINIYGTDQFIEGGGVLFPIAVISNDDSNVVRYELVPRFMATIFGALPDKGDGTLPEMSVNPPPEHLSNPFLKSIPLPMMVHADMCKEQTVVNKVLEAIMDSLESFAGDKLGIEFKVK